MGLAIFETVGGEGLEEGYIKSFDFLGIPVDVGYFVALIFENPGLGSGVIGTLNILSHISNLLFNQPNPLVQLLNTQVKLHLLELIFCAFHEGSQFFEQLVLVMSTTIGSLLYFVDFLFEQD